MAAPLPERGDARQHRLASGRPGGADRRHRRGQHPQTQQLGHRSGAGPARIQARVVGPDAGRRPASDRRAAARAVPSARPARASSIASPTSELSAGQLVATPSPRIDPSTSTKYGGAGHAVVAPRLRGHHHRDPGRGELAQARPDARARLPWVTTTVRTPRGQPRLAQRLPEPGAGRCSRWSERPAAWAPPPPAPKSSAIASPAGVGPRQRRRPARPAAATGAAGGVGAAAPGSRSSPGGPEPAQDLGVGCAAVRPPAPAAPRAGRSRPRRSPPSRATSAWERHGQALAGSRPRASQVRLSTISVELQFRPGTLPGCWQITSRQTTSVCPETWVLHWP